MRKHNRTFVFFLSLLFTAGLLSFAAPPSTAATDTIIIEQGNLASLSAQAQTNWVEQAYLKASNPDSADIFGRSVAISGDTLVVGATNEAGNGSSPDDDSLLRVGAAYVFARQGASWLQQAYLKASNPDEFDEFGTSGVKRSLR